MGILKNAFTWWDGSGFTTWLDTRLRGGRVGSDALGNVYYQAKRDDPRGRRRRWVIYNGSNDASRVPPEWFGWLHNTVDELPADLPIPVRAFEKGPLPNLTGTRDAYRPAGALEAGGRRAAATGDYEAWSPGQS